MIRRTNQFIATPPVDWLTEQTGIVGGRWAKLRVVLDAYLRWSAAEAVFTELSCLSDASLERRGIARGDLHRLISEMTERQ